VNVTVGDLPAVPLATLTSVKVVPGNCVELSGIVCAPMIDASNSCWPYGMWQVAHSSSLNCGPPG
jgi:hypothetical protein